MRKRTLGWTLSVALLALGLGGLAPAQSADESSRARGGWLGVFTQTLTPALRDGLGYDGDGVLVRSVVPDSPADRAGIRKGDVIVSVAGKRIDSPDELARVVRGSDPGRSVSIKLERDGSSESFSVRLEERPSDADSETRWTRRAPRAPAVPETPEVPEVPRDLMIFPDGPEGDVERLVIRGGPRLGVRIEPLTEDLASALGVEDHKGVLVVEVMKDTPAQQAGMKAGDVIVRVADKDIEDSDALVEALRESEGGTRITVVRGGSRRTLDVELGKTRSERFGPSMRGNRVFERRLDREQSNPELRKELEGLKRELEELRRELEEMRRN